MAYKIPKGFMLPGQYKRIAAGVARMPKLQVTQGLPQMSPPPGSYDPALDAGYDSAARGYRYGTEDVGTGDLRGTEDYNFGAGQINQQRDRTLADMLTAQNALASRQGEQAAGAGVIAGSGALTQALSKRTANYDLNVKRVRDSADQQLGRLALLSGPGTAENPAGGRDWQDRHTGLARQGEELANFGLDTNASRWMQAGANGYVAPPAPTVSSYLYPAGRKKVPTRPPRRTAYGRPF